MPQPLDDRIAAAMGEGARIATAADLIGEVASAIAAAQAEHDQMDAISKSATANEADADAAADAAVKLARKIVRLGAKREQLEGRQEELANSDRQMRLRTEHREIKARRDALATELADRWPKLTAEIVELLRRIEETDADCRRANRMGIGERRLISAEAIARNCPGSFYDNNDMISRFGKVRLPSLTGRGMQQLAWPPLGTHEFMDPPC